MSHICKGCGEISSNLCSGNNTESILTTCFFSLPPKQFSLLSSLIGILLIDNLDLNQQNSLGNFIVNVGQAIMTSASQGQLLQSNTQQNDNAHQQINILKKQICALERELDGKN